MGRSKVKIKSQWMTIWADIVKYIYIIHGCAFLFDIGDPRVSMVELWMHP